MQFQESQPITPSTDTSRPFSRRSGMRIEDQNIYAFERTKAFSRGAKMRFGFF
jgi:hypothetical protein